MLAELPQHIHLVGIGGIGLSAIARVLAMRGYQISGSDQRASGITDALQREGVRVAIGHAAENLGDARVVVVSSAVPEGNPEILAARDRGIPVMDRRTFLPLVLSGDRCIAVAGTHGKTTTSGMIAHVLRAGGLDPSFVVGGLLQDLGTNGAAGKGEWFVIEADEYGRMFHGLTPEIAVVTTIEMDHPDCFADIDAMREAFREFLGNVVDRGLIVASLNGAQVARLLSEHTFAAPVRTYGQASGVTYEVGAIEANARGGVDFFVSREGSFWVTCSLSLPGVHNALNATAALIVAEAVGVPLTTACDALADYQGVRRRFELKGETWGVTVIDDYGHHPTEIAATMAAARMRYPGRRLWAIVQPHTFSRLQALWDGFRTCLADADEVIITDVYAARSREVVTQNDAARLVMAIDHPSIRHIAGPSDVQEYVLAHLRPGDVLITLGAGDGYLIGERVLEALGGKAA